MLKPPNARTPPCMRALKDMSKPLYERFMSSLVLSTLATCDATPGFGSHIGTSEPSIGLTTLTWS